MKVLPILLLMMSSYFYSQNVVLDQSDRSILIRNGAFSNSEKDLGILGSQYLYDSYLGAEIVNIKAPVQAKYNAYKDEIEVLKDEKGFIIARIPEYKLLKFTSTNEYLELVNYSDEKNVDIQGYLFQMAKKGDFTLYRREKIILEKGKPATSSYDSDIPSKYKKAAVKYFITAENGKVVQVPDNKKKLIELFPSKKDKLETYIKAQKLNPSKESDLINFLKEL